MGDNEDILARLRTERDQARALARAEIESDNYDKDSETLKANEERAASLDKQIERYVTLVEHQKASDAIDGRFAKAAKSAERKAQTEVQTRESWGHAFTRSEAFGEYRGRGQSARFEIDAGEIQHRALPTGLTDLINAGLTFGKTTTDLTPTPAPTPLLDSISKVPVSSNAVEFVSWAKVAGGAAVVAEKGAKPSAEWAPTVTADTLENIAVYTQLTRQLIEDAPSVRSYIDGELVRDVVMAEEAQAATALSSAVLPTAEGEDLLAAIRVGIGTVQAAGYSPNAVLMNPADWAALDVAVMSSTLVGPMVRQSFWGVTPIPSTGQAAGTAIVGDFKTAVTQWFRSQVGLYITDSHADTFLSNVFTLLAERRSLTAVVRPQALVEVSAAAAP